MIGNSVPPPVAAEVLRRIVEACGGAKSDITQVAAE